MSPEQSFAGSRIVITGASRGLGLASAQLLAGLGASLALVARDRTRLDAARETLPGGPHDVFSFDVTSADAWAEVADDLASHQEIHGLVTAAALITPIGPLGSISIEDFRRTLDVNVCGTLLAIDTLLPGLSRVGGSVVTFSGGGATAPFVRFDAYAASKAAVVRLTENLAVELKGRGLRLNSIAPGFVVTEMHEATLAAGPDLVGQAYFDRTSQAVNEGAGDSPAVAAELVAFLLSSAAAGITGKLISARWDPWRDQAFQSRLRNEADLATLRRIDDQAFTALRS